MATPVKMPELGESITEGTITRWIKQEGDRVEADEPLFEVSTDKDDTEVPSPVAGVLKTIKVQADETVEVGAELAIIEQDGEASGDGDGDGEAEKSAEAAEADSDTAEEAAQAEEGSEEAGSEQERESEAAEDDGEDEKPKAEASSDGGTTTVTMPELGESITEGTITRWL
jgi:pyruvate dehydrogenase E2 component (dihydrolipoamide acetyltransferase)